MSWFVPWALAWYQRLTKTKVTSEWVAKAVALTDEQARKFAKGLTADGPTTPKQKLEYAKQYLRDFAPKAVTALREVEIEKLIEAGVNLLRRQTPTTELAPLESHVDTRELR